MEREDAVCEIVVRCAVPPSHDGSHASKELAHVEGLHEIVVGPGIEPLEAILKVVAGCEDDDGRVVLFSTHGAEHRHAVDGGQSQVEEH